MVINLFERGKGIKYLQELYDLEKADIRWIQNNLFDYNCELTTPEEAEKLINLMRKQMHESEESLVQTRQFMLDRDRLERWVKDDADDLFLERLGEREYSDVQFTLVHITTAIDDGESIRTNGLQKLTTLLEIESPLSTFLAKEVIVFDLSRKVIKINGDTHSLQEYRFGELRGRLFYYRGEIEAFISGEMDDMKNYSDVPNCP